MNKYIIAVNLVIGFTYRNFFYFFAFTLEAPMIGLLFISGLICDILKLNATCYLYGHN